jgi:hypothetical protein
MKKLVIMTLMLISALLFCHEGPNGSPSIISQAEEIYYAGQTELYKQNLKREPASIQKKPKILEDKFSRAASFFMEQY